jgi:hypothetical protein
VRSIAVASPNAGSESVAGLVASIVAEEGSATRLGRETVFMTELEINRATGCPSPVCAKIDGDIASSVIVMNPSKEYC